MRQFWWVNHKQTFNQEIEHQYLWSPKTSKNGVRNRFYDNMRAANPGDIVLSYASQLIRYVGRVVDFAFTAPKPSEFGATGSYWSNEGWLLPVFWTRLDPPIRPRDLLHLIGPILPEKYSPLQHATGKGNQGVYLAAIPRDIYEVVRAHTHIDDVRLETGGANRLTFQNVVEELDDRIEIDIRSNLTMDDTIRTATIQARRGQGIFRSNVQKVEQACRLTGIRNPALLIASHIRPWRSCETADQRLDGANGLLLTPDADLLFDRGFISFEDSGEVRVSPRFDQNDLRRLGLGEQAWKQLGFSEAPMPWMAQAFSDNQRAYLNYHRAQVYIT
ncbi:HNH endonuclease [Reyranella aquatilis]|uniref:HNH endonuclease n=1 Tax=Reyranella aquatilis TaxID=2035356 RepID=A0ABS8L290_9HYPH|nr:HNH endonuclease [Reyranella aquatilis]MCC8432452.1 HNH endonuclease [Reyranella aquatilis]